MPAGPEPLGLAYFAGVKLAGYSLAGLQLNRHFRVRRPRPVIFGVSRTCLGLAVGISFASIALWSGLTQSELPFLIGMAPVRFGEWLLIIWLFYRRHELSRERWLGAAGAGTLWSYFLDIPAIMSVFVLPGGAWIC
jgi:hypothetical protein